MKVTLSEDDWRAIATLSKFDLEMLLAEIDEHGWEVARVTFETIKAADLRTRCHAELLAGWDRHRAGATDVITNETISTAARALGVTEDRLRDVLLHRWGILE